MPDPQQAWPTRLAALALLLAIAAVAGWRAQRPTPDHRLPAADCLPWMADALPGIGPKRREGATAAIRAGSLVDLPAQARSLAEQVFRGPTAIRW